MEHPYLLGLIGAALPDVIRLVKGRHEGPLPAFITSASFLVGFPLLLGIGALAIYLGEPTSVKEALAYGFGAPELVSRLLSNQGPTTGAQVDRNGLSLREWWTR